MMITRAILCTKGFMYENKIIQGSYTFQNIEVLSKEEYQDVYRAIMKTPINVPCTVTIVNNSISIVCIDGNNINIKY